MANAIAGKLKLVISKNDWVKILGNDCNILSGILVKDSFKNLLNVIAMLQISAVLCVSSVYSQQPSPLQPSPLQPSPLQPSPLQQAVPSPPPQPLLGAPIPAPNSVPSAPGVLNDPVRSPLDPMNVDSLPPTLFPQTPVFVDNLTRDKSIYGSVKDDPAIFINVDFGGVLPNLTNQLQSTVTYQNGRVVNVNLPSATLDWAFQPHLELGYRLAGEQGGFAVSWRGFSSSGSSSEPINNLPANVNTEVSFNIGDLDYIAPMFQPFNKFDVFFRIGARIGGIYFSTTQENKFESFSETNYMFGGGPHFAIETHKRFERIPGFSHFAIVDGTVLIGQTSQNFSATQGPFSATSSQFVIQSIPAVTFQTGFSYTPIRASNTKFSVGYQLEQWWNIANVNESKGQLGDNGFFLRCQVDF